MNIIFANLNSITLIAWLIFFCVVLARLIRPLWFKDISYRWFVCGAVMLHVLYGAVATVGQYQAWATAHNDIARALLSAPLPHEVPLPWFLEWARFLFEKAHGYFVFYSFEHFFLKTIALFMVTGVFYLFLAIRARYRANNFREGDIMLIILAMLISGWPGVIVLLPLGLISAVVISLAARIIYEVERTTLSYAFLVAAPFALIFATPILSALHLYSLLKL